MAVKIEPASLGIDRRKAQAVRTVRKKTARLAVMLFVVGLFAPLATDRFLRWAFPDAPTIVVAIPAMGLLILFVGLAAAAISISAESEEEILRRLAECSHDDDSPANPKAPTM